MIFFTSAPPARSERAHVFDSRYAEDEETDFTLWEMAVETVGLALILLPSYVARAWRCWSVRWLLIAGVVIESTHWFTHHLWPHLKAVLLAGR